MLWLKEQALTLQTFGSYPYLDHIHIWINTYRHWYVISYIMSYTIRHSRRNY